MRKIKFRLWFAGQMFYNVVKMDCLKGEVKKIYVNHDLEDVSIDAADTWTGQDDYKLMQFTNLLDKNGKEIYEGDILQWNEDDEVKAGVMEWNINNACFRMKTMSKIVVRPEMLELIGNIHQHPELLKYYNKAQVITELENTELHPHVGTLPPWDTSTTGDINMTAEDI